ncbi:MAG: hypothetical protein LIP23_05795 [Planctomycetes bacterium]|nr:hypothetical protein [Planctomycetota bacterium]
MNAEQFLRLRRRYEKKWSVRLGAVDENGELVSGRLPPALESTAGRKRVRELILEAVRWGDAAYELLMDGSMAWVGPLLTNSRIDGGLVAHLSKRKMFSDDRDEPIVDARRAGDELRRIAEEDNLTNAQLLEQRRGEYLSERRRAEAIHAYKAYSPDFRSIYIREEPALMTAIRKGDREEARSLLNRILVVLHYQAGENLDLIKSFFLEIVTLMCRAAVETGCDASEILGRNYEAFAHLYAISSFDGIGPWLHDIMERLIDSIHLHRNDSPAALIQAAMAYMHENLDKDISRDMVADAAHLSPAHFSRLFKKEMRESFTDMLNRMRVD